MQLTKLLVLSKQKAQWLLFFYLCKENTLVNRTDLKLCILYRVVRSCALTRIECVKIGAIAYNVFVYDMLRINRQRLPN